VLLEKVIYPGSVRALSSFSVTYRPGTRDPLHRFLWFAKHRQLSAICRSGTEVP
jgi:hypothetical protein